MWASSWPGLFFSCEIERHGTASGVSARDGAAGDVGFERFLFAGGFADVFEFARWSGACRDCLPGAVDERLVAALGEPPVADTFAHGCRDHSGGAEFFVGGRVVNDLSPETVRGLVLSKSGAEIGVSSK